MPPRPRLVGTLPLTTLETYTKYNTLIYGDCRQVEKTGLGTGICKACATRIQAISAGF